MLPDSDLRKNDEVAEVDKVQQDAEKEASLPAVYLESPSNMKTFTGAHGRLERLTHFLTRHGIETRGYARLRSLFFLHNHDGNPSELTLYPQIYARIHVSTRCSLCGFRRI